MRSSFDIGIRLVHVNHDSFTSFTMDRLTVTVPCVRTTFFVSKLENVHMVILTLKKVRPRSDEVSSDREHVIFRRRLSAADGWTACAPVK